MPNIESTQELELTETELSDDQLQNVQGACAGLGLGGGLHLGFGGHRFGFGGFRGFGFGGFAPLQTVAVVPQVTQVVEQPVAVQTTTTALQTTSCGC